MTPVESEALFSFKAHCALRGYGSSNGSPVPMLSKFNARSSNSEPESFLDQNLASPKKPWVLLTAIEPEFAPIIKSYLLPVNTPLKAVVPAYDPLNEIASLSIERNSMKGSCAESIPAATCKNLPSKTETTEEENTPPLAENVAPVPDKTKLPEGEVKSFLLQYNPNEPVTCSGSINCHRLPVTSFMLEL